MIRRYLPALLIIASLASVIVWFAQHTYWKEVIEPVPPRGEAATDTFYVAKHLVAMLGAQPEGRHEVPVLPPAGAAIVTAPGA